MKKGDLDSKEHLRTHSSYIIGIVAIVLSLFAPLSGIVFGIIGLVQSNKQKNEISKKAKKFNITAIVIGAVLFAVSLFVAISQGLNLVDVSSGY